MRCSIRSLALAALLIPAGSSWAADTPGSYLLQTVLLYGAKEGKADLEGVPPNVVAALEDAAGFLPYKSYRLVDVAVLRSSGNAQGLLSSADGRRFELAMRFQPGEGGKLDFQRFELEALVPVMNDKLTSEDGKPRLEHAPPTWERRRVIASDFSVKVGETIVVGSSKLHGTSDAVVVLFTVLP
jgi:hypothetical protein